MAKAASEHEGRDGSKFYDQGGKGKKPCPKCGKFIAGRFNGKPCPNPKCDYTWPVSEKGGKPKGRKVEAPAVDPMAVIAKVRDFGGVAKVQKALNEIAALQAKVDEAGEALAVFNDGFFGGVEGAEAAIKLMGDLEAALKGK